MEKSAKFHAGEILLAGCRTKARQAASGEHKISDKFARYEFSFRSFILIYSINPSCTVVFFDKKMIQNSRDKSRFLGS